MKIDIVTFDGMDELDAVAPLEVLRRANFDVRLSGFHPTVTCAYELVISIEGPPRDDADLIISPAADGSRAARKVRALKSRANAGSRSSRNRRHAARSSHRSALAR